MKHLISSKVIDKELFAKVVEKAIEFQNTLESHQTGVTPIGLQVATLFFEPSTRTRLSFESATHLMGGQVLSMESGASSSKNESIHDTLMTASQVADLVVVRHPEDIFANKDLLVNIRCPVINAGNGYVDHPTQALLDAFTIETELDGIEGKKVLLVGDLKYGRAAHALIYCLHNLGAEIYCYSPAALQLPNEFAPLINQVHAATFDLVLEETDAIYMTRQQVERWPSSDLISDIQWGRFCIDQSWLAKMKEDAIIMHPMPREKEIPNYVDHDARSKYFKQIRNGVAVRAAIMSILSAID